MDEVKPMPDDYKVVWDVLVEHRSISLDKLTGLTGFNQRKVRQIIKELIENFDCLIGSNSNPGGYFIIETQDQFDWAMAELSSRIYELTVRKNHLAKAWSLRKTEKLF